MSEKKFLTVMAVFDGATQERLGDLQADIIKQVGEGTQTMGIPFHLTLGSYPVDAVDEVVARIETVANASSSFEVLLSRYETFGDRVLFLEPNIPEELLTLRKSFECDFANGFQWVPHATLFCGEADEVRNAIDVLPEISEPIKAQIVGIELGEFFPARKIIRIDF